MKPQLIIHAGLHKTGTSYIQRFLHENARLLNQHGVLYPWKPEGAYNHTHLVALFRGAAFKRLSIFFQRTAAKGYQTILISSEDWSKDFNSIKRVKQFRDLLADRFDVKFLYYLRRQDHLWESVYAEVAKSWFNGHIDSDLKFRFDFAERLGPLMEVFRQKAIIVRPYNPALWADGDLAYDVLSAIGISDRSGFVLPLRENESMTRRKTLFLSSVDKMKLPDRAAFRESVRLSPTIHDDGLRYLASPAERAAFYEQFRQSNTETLALFGVNDADAWLGYTLPDDDWSPPEPITEQEMLCTWSMIAKHAGGAKPSRES